MDYRGCYDKFRDNIHEFEKIFYLSNQIGFDELSYQFHISDWGKEEWHKINKDKLIDINQKKNFINDMMYKKEFKKKVNIFNENIYQKSFMNSLNDSKILIKSKHSDYKNNLEIQKNVIGFISDILEKKKENAVEISNKILNNSTDF